MNYFFAVILFFFSNVVFAIGSIDINKENIEKYNVKLGVEYDSYQECFNIKAKFPNTLNFKDMGEREIWNASFEKANDEKLGWRLARKGTYIPIPIRKENKFHNLAQVCLSEQDLNSGYITVVYGGPQGSPPMVLVFKLATFRD